MNKDVINNAFINTIEKMLELHTHLCIVKHSHDYLLIEKKNKQHWTTLISLEEFLNCRDKINLYATQAQLDSYKNPYITFHIQDGLEQNFFLIWLENTPLQYYDELFSISGKIIPLSVRLKAVLSEGTTSTQQSLFESLIKAKKKNVVRTPTNQELQMVLSTLENFICSDNKKIELLEAYCKNHTVLLNRIEAQTILFNYIKKFESFESVKEKLNFCLKDFKTQNDYFEKTNPVYFFRLNKKDLFKSVYNPSLTNKYQLVYLMEELYKFLTQSDILKKCDLDRVYLQDLETEHTSFTWVFHTASLSSNINYLSLLKELIEKSSEFINVKNEATQGSFAEIFKVLLNRYFLEKLLKDKDDGKNETIKKI